MWIACKGRFAKHSELLLKTYLDQFKKLSELYELFEKLFERPHANFGRKTR